MAAPFSSDPWYRDTEPNDSSEWIELDLTRLMPEPPFRLFAKRLESSSPDSERFLHDPLRYLLEDERVVRSWRITADWHVTTFIVNHHRTLSKIHLFVMAAVAPAEETVALTIYKESE